jgi:putative nucleotidyltransferase with HDIG domain
MDQVKSTPKTDPSRWRPRPVAARVVATGVVVAPAAISVCVAVILVTLVHEPAATSGRIAWWIGVLGLSSVALMVCERVARDALALPMLLKMGLAFPEEAPKRLELARRASNSRSVGRLIEAARLQGLPEDPVLAADRVVVLTAGLSAHDRTTQGHAERVRVLTDLVASELELPEPDRDRLRWAALLHDIGKLAVHEEFLNKRGRLSQAERELVRRHTLEGARLVEPLSDWLGEWVLAVPEHHERHDGGGYPYGLEGEEISLGGRIVAVVDAYDLMTSPRSYRKPATPDTARAEIARLSGSQFDPVVVRAFLAIPLTQLHRIQPRAWLGSFPVPLAGPGVDRLVRTATALVVACAVLGLASWRPWSHNGVVAQSPSALGSGATVPGTSADPSGGVATPSSSGGAQPGPVTLFGHADPKNGSGKVATVEDMSRSGVRDRELRTGEPGSRSGSSGPGGSDGGSSRPPGPGTSDPGTTVGSSSPPTSTTSSGSPPPTTGGSPPTTTQKPPPTTTTRPQPPPPPPPPPASATNLKASSSCENVVLGPQVILSWTDSRSSDVTGYEILRSANGSSYSGIAEVSAGSRSYTDTSVEGLGVTYWYKVEALSTHGEAMSSAVSVMTPLLCL